MEHYVSEDKSKWCEEIHGRDTFETNDLGSRHEKVKFIEIILGVKIAKCGSIQLSRAYQIVFEVLQIAFFSKVSFAETDS